MTKAGMDHVKLVDGHIMRAVPWMIRFLTIGIFVVDLLAPVGIAVSILYAIPILLTLFSPRARDPLYFAAAVTVLTWIDLLVKPASVPIPYAVSNRALGTMLIWGIAIGLIQYKRTNQELKSARVEQAHAEGLMMAAQEARYYADRDAVRAAVGRNEAEEQLLISRLRLESIIESAMDAIITVDEEQRVVLFNRAAEQMFGCPTREAIGQPLHRFLPSRYRDAHRHHVQTFGQSGVTTRMMGKLGAVMGLRSNGEEFPIEAAISHIAVENRKYYTVILRDITEREQADHLVRQSEERYRRLIAVSPYAILVSRGDRIVFANDQAIKLFGAVKADEILGKSLVELFHPDHHDAVRERIHELIEGSPQVPMLEEKIVTLGGGTVDVECSAARFADEEGPAILVMLRDVSDQRRLLEQLRRTERIAELGTLASGMAHEIGTPMNVILGRAEYMMDRVTEEPIKKGLQTIVTQVERITKVMNQLLSFARRKAPERRALDLRGVVEDGMEMFHERLSRNQIQVEMRMADVCPMALADQDQMSQVFINLVMNAVHAMPDGGTLRVGLAPEQQMVKLTVADTGHGIPRDAVKKIFEPFFTTKEFGKGTGLGLTVVKGIIEEHQGSIAVESEEQKGTTVTVLLPIASTS
ncbi:MAG: PAS domain S-box protein [Nitrospira sp.]|nr:PAS domain S-box protein [Nitrospira sp.]